MLLLSYFFFGLVQKRDGEFLEWHFHFAKQFAPALPPGWVWVLQQNLTSR